MGLQNLLFSVTFSTVDPSRVRLGAGLLPAGPRSLSSPLRALCLCKHPSPECFPEGSCPGPTNPLSVPRINLAPTVGFEDDAGSRTTHHFMYPESAKNLAANVSFVLVPFKTLDLVWITSALSTGQIRL